MAIPRVPGQSGRGSRFFFAVLMAWSIGLMGPWLACGQEPPPDPTPVARRGSRPRGSPTQEPAADPQGGQVLTQGPVHEAFAAPVVHDPKAAPIVAKAPPDPIQELPPDQKPSGQNIQWIPGYWAWDVLAQRLPVGQRRLARAAAGHPVGPRLLAPGRRGKPVGPRLVDAGRAAARPGSGPGLGAGPGDVSAAPAGEPGVGPEHAAARRRTWPGRRATGSGKQGGYAWRPGFWAAVQPNWIWMPPHYVWTPSGYLFVPGYWDLPVANRGLMFAPVYYPQPVYAQPGFAFTPSISIVGSAVTANLFVQASTNQYLFGNYYAQNYVSVGIVPWFSFSFSVGRPVYYDPLFSYYAVVNVRQNPRWIVQVREAYVLRRDNVAMRPPGTYAEQVRIERNVVDHAEYHGGRPSDHGHAAEPAGGRPDRREEPPDGAGRRGRAPAVTWRKWPSCTRCANSACNRSGREQGPGSPPARGR